MIIISMTVVPGTEELSGDEELPGTPPRNNVKPVIEKPKPSPKPKLPVKRPTILKRKGSRNFQMCGKDWGERCVDMFEVIAQIGEGKPRGSAPGPLIQFKIRSRF